VPSASNARLAEATTTTSTAESNVAAASGFTDRTEHSHASPPEATFHVPSRSAANAADHASAPVPIPLALPPDSDLVMVETRFAASEIETDATNVPGPRRVRPPRPPIPEEPLQLVETRKEQASP
jgi:hypothetical protein